MTIAPPPVPTATAAPQISGTLIEGQTLTEGHAVWEGAKSVTYQWSRCDGSGHSCVAIAGATGPSYVLGVADVGASLTVAEVASNDYGDSAPVASVPTSQVLSGIPAALAAPSLVGAAAAGQTLAVEHGTWSNNPGAFAYQWLRCDGRGAQCRPVAGATGMSYKLGVEDVHATVRVEERATNSFGTSAPQWSAPSGRVTDRS